MTFSERQGFKPIRQILQTKSIDIELRNRLWNVLRKSFPRISEDYSFKHPDNLYFLNFCNRLWHEHFKLAVDKIPAWPHEAIAGIRDYFFNPPWYHAYDLLEFVTVKLLSPHSLASRTQELNAILESELSAYRFLGDKLAPISSERELTTVEHAIAQTTDQYSPTSEHLKQAVALLAQKPNPDYRNSIKESISAVEALCAVITGDTKATLGQALKFIDTEAPLHGALRSAFEKLYGYTSDADGIRHALMEETKLEQEDAVFMLVACSAFVSYVIAKRARRQG
jgi:hypothetical protein